MRLDLYLYEKGLCSSRTEAKSFINEGAVSVCGKVINKPSYDISEGAEVFVDKSSKRFVSRGGLKLLAAIEAFGASANGKLCLDVGASSGGFTDCLLQHGASRVTAVDSGHSQLAPSLLSDPRVISLENYNARYMSHGDFEYTPELAVMDVSFISATYIIGGIFSVLAPGGDFICLIKPQFEVGKEKVGKGGIVKNEKYRNEALKKVIDYAKGVGFIYLSHITSPIQGGDGNIEFLAHFKKGDARSV